MATDQPTPGLASGSAPAPAPAPAPLLSPGAPPIRAASPLEHQVAGHGGVMEDESGELVIKPALPREVAFYQLVGSAPRSSPLSGLKPFLPKFLGVLQLHGQDDGMGGVDPIPGTTELPQSVVLENLASPFTRPCVMDIKLGTVLHGPDATPEKAARMEKKARESTIGKKGMRMTGCKIWHAPTQSWIVTPRSFGYEMTPERLPEGMVRFFPLPNDELPFLSDDETEAPKPPFTEHGMPARLTYRVLAALDDELARLESALTNLEIRAVGASLLVVYEGDPHELSAAFERYDAKRISDAARSLAQTTTPVRALGEEIFDSGSEPDEEWQSVMEEEDDGGKPFTLRLIDFAHTWLAQGEGPDKGLLFGLETVRGLVKTRMETVKAYMDKHEPATPSSVSIGFGGGVAP